MKPFIHFLKSLVVVSPWWLKRRLLTRFFGYKIDPAARIGWSWVFPRYLEMEANSSIASLTVAIHLDAIIMHEASSIGRNNWVTGYPSNDSRHFGHISNRTSKLLLHRHAAITKQHHIDCTETIEIGAFSIIAGYQSQLLTHSIDIEQSRQDAHPIRIGHHCFVGTNVVILGGASLADFCVLGAKSLLSRSIETPYSLVAGTPAQVIRPIPENAAFFTRIDGFVH